MIGPRWLSRILPALKQFGGDERPNRDTAFAFLPFDTLESDTNNICTLCQSKPSFFRYELLGDAGGIVRGGCCLPCFPNLLRRAKRHESDAVGR
jgi:hypothetical protein